MPATYENISTTTLSSQSNSTTFSNISGNYTDLILVGHFGVTGSGSSVLLKVGNGTIDTGSNYSESAMGAGGASGNTLVVERNAARGDIPMFTNIHGFHNTGISNSFIIHFMNYSNTSTYKYVLIRTANGGGSSYPGTAIGVGLWRSSSAINTIQLLGGSTDFQANSTFTLYGVKGA